jgi:hypothetical protein
MKIAEGMTCYYCGKKATSSEHVPPRCFFPKDRRNNLIQVPACEEHNENTSKDDEYVLFIISSYIGNNEVGKEHSVDKGIKPVLRSEALQKVIAENSINVLAYDGDNLQPTKMINIDRERFNNEIIKMSRALFYHTYGKRWERNLYVGTNSMLCGDGEIEDQGKLINTAKQILAVNGIDSMNPFRGDNQEVFKYRFLETGIEDAPILQMIFYDCFELWTFVKI